MTVYMHDRNILTSAKVGKYLRIIPAAELEIKCN